MELSASVPLGGSTTPALDLTLATPKLNMLLLPPPCAKTVVTRPRSLASCLLLLVAAALWDKEKRLTESTEEHGANWQHGLPVCSWHSTLLPLSCTPPSGPNPPIVASITACMPIYQSPLSRDRSFLQPTSLILAFSCWSMPEFSSWPNPSPKERTKKIPEAQVLYTYFLYNKTLGTLSSLIFFPAPQINSHLTALELVPCLLRKLNCQKPPARCSIRSSAVSPLASSSRAVLTTPFLLPGSL